MSSLQDWRPVRLGDVCEFKYGKSLPETARLGGDVPVFGSNGEVGRHNKALTAGPTIVIGRKGSFGEVNYSSVPCWPIDTTYYVDETATDVDLRWLTYRLSALGLNRLNRAAAVPGLNREDAYRQTLLLPPLPEQRRIAGILDKAGALRAKCRAALKKLDELTQSIFLDMFGDLFASECDWPVTSVSEFVASFESGKNLVADDEDDSSSTFRVLKVSAVTSLRFRPEESKALPPDYVPPPSHFVKEGDLLFSRANTAELIGATALVERAPAGLVLPDKLWRFRWYDPPRADPRFVHWLFRQPRFRFELGRRATGTSGSMKNISQEKVFAIKVAFPPLSLQKKFGQLASAVERLRETAERALASSDSAFTSLQHHAYLGEL